MDETERWTNDKVVSFTFLISLFVPLQNETTRHFDNILIYIT